MFLYETQHWVDNEFKVENKVHGDQKTRFMGIYHKIRKPVSSHNF